MRRIEHAALWGGVAAPVLYVAIVLASGSVLPGYDHIADPISALTAAGRHDIRWIEAAFGLYNLLLLVFASAGLTRPDRRWRPVFSTLIVTASAGLLMWPFPMDMPGTPVSAAGLAHLGLAAVASISTVVAVLLSVLNWHRAERREMTLFSAFCLFVIVSSGLASAAAAALGWPIVGLLERLTIGAFELWLVVTATLLATTSSLVPAKSSH